MAPRPSFTAKAENAVDLFHHSFELYPPRHVLALVDPPCERVVLGKGAKGPHWRVCTRYLSSTSWKKKLRARKMNRTIGEKIDSTKRKGESRRIKHTT